MIMRKLKHIFSLIATVAAVAWQAQAADYKMEVMDFTELKVTDNINVDYKCSADSAGWIFFSCDPSLASKLIFSNNNSCLHVQVAMDEEPHIGLPTITVCSSALNKVQNDSDSTLRVLNNVPVKQFKAKVVGNGTMIISNVEATSIDAGISTGKGHVVVHNSKSVNAKLSNIGTGPIEAGGLTAAKVKAYVIGTGDVDCTATESLTIYGAGSGKVYYSGSPEKITNRSMGVKAFPIGNTATESE